MSTRNHMTKGHRNRLRERFIQGGLTGFHDYEILELLLGYSIPRKDTKPIARKLLSKFKSFSKVLDATDDQILEVEGIGPSTVTYLRIIREFISKYFEHVSIEKKQFLNLDDLIAYLRAIIGGKANEVLYVMYLNSRNELIKAESLGEGTISESIAFPRKIVEGALKCRATSLILAHNHPEGIAEPSDNENAITNSARSALSTVDILLQDHIIITDNEFYSFRKEGFFD